MCYFNNYFVNVAKDICKGSKQYDSDFPHIPVFKTFSKMVILVIKFLTFDRSQKRKLGRLSQTKC